MKTRRIVMGGVCGLCMLAFMAAPCLAADDGAQPEAPKGPVEIKGGKKTVRFAHDKGHKTIECVVCHHKVDGKPAFAKCADSGCHDDLTAKKGQSSLYFVMHSKSEELRHQNCMGCHVKTVAEKPNLKKQLTGCTGSYCHPAKKDQGETNI